MSNAAAPSVQPEREFWQRMRKGYKARQKAKKEEFATKEEYMQSDLYKQKQARRDRAEKWHAIDKHTYPWNKPEVVIDLSYGEDMVDKERRSAVSQVLHLYGALRKSARPLKVSLTSVQGEMHQLLSRLDGFDANWKVFQFAQPFEEVFDKTKVIYLSPESPNVLMNVELDKIYVIGGLVDHNRLKGLSLERSTKKGVTHARLPLQEIKPNFNFSSLNPNHVFEIISDVAAGLSWDEALEKHVPRRQGYRPDHKGHLKVAAEPPQDSLAPASGDDTSSSDSTAEKES